MPGIVIVAIVGFGILMVFGLIFGILAEKKRREALHAWCVARGLRFNGVRDKTFSGRFAAFKCLQRGDDRYAQYQMDGELGGRPCTCFIYHYETSSTDSKGNRQTTDWYISGAVVRSEFVLEDLFMRPETFFDKIAGVVGFDDIDFESAEFSRAFHVKAPNRKWAYDVIHARTMEFMLSRPKHGIELHGPFAMAYKSGHMKPEQFEIAAGLVNGILDRLPAYVIEQQKART